LILRGLTYTDLAIGSLVLAIIVGVETGFIIGLIQRAGSWTNLFRLTSRASNKDGNKTTEERHDASEIPDIKQTFIKKGGTRLVDTRNEDVRN
jgi:hypothetical protein